MISDVGSVCLESNEGLPTLASRVDFTRTRSTLKEPFKSCKIVET